MSDLVVLDFDGVHTADEALNKLRSLQKEYLIDLDDACVVEREQDGRVHITVSKQSTSWPWVPRGVVYQGPCGVRSWECSL